MKLLSLKINDPFSSLFKEFELKFREPFEESNYEDDWSKFHPYCFAGLNGSGKSNVLEALANIFYHLEGCVNVNQPDNFKAFFAADESSPNAYELKYYINPKTGSEYVIKNMVHVFISKKVNEPPIMQITEYPFDESLKSQVIPVVSDKEKKIPAVAKIYLPDLIIGYSSGENEVLSIPFLKTRLLHYDEYVEDVKGNIKYYEPESNLLYIDYEMSQAVLLSNFIFQDSKVLEPLDTELGILEIKRFRMNLNLHTIEKYGILDQFNEKVQAFRNCSTTFYEDDKNLTLDFWINPDSKKAFRKNFKDIFDLFQSFQILYTLNYRAVDEEIKSEVYQSKGYYTDGKMPTPSPSEKVFYFLDYYIEKRINDKGDIKSLLLKNLSDGEQQFLHTIGICLMLKGRSALLLLDEPETHFNPDWRSKFISTLQKSLENSSSNNLMRDILVTSHSPFIISDCYPNKVIVFERDKQPKKARELSIHTYGTSVNLLTTKIFGKKETIGEYSLDKINIYRKEFYDGGETEDIMRRLNEELGDSIEKLLFIKEMHSKKITNK